jgi:hypothetical protein
MNALVFEFKPLSLVFYVGLFCMLMIVAPVIRGQSHQKDTSEYLNGPTFDLNGQFLSKADEQLIGLRTYVRAAWEKRQKTQFTVLSYSREGARTTCTFYIEGDSNDRWRIVSKCSSEDCPYASKTLCLKKRNMIYTKVYDKVFIRSVEFNKRAGNNVTVDMIVLLNSTTSQERIF